MLVREIVARHLPDGGGVAVLADADVAAELRRLSGHDGQAAGGAAGLLLVDAGDGLDAADRLGGAEQAPVVVLLLRCGPAELPVGRLADLGRLHGLEHVEAVPLSSSGRWQVAVVAARPGAPLRGYLTGAQVDGDEAAAASRARWEWGIGSLAARAAEAALEAELATARAALADREAELATVRAQAEQAQKRLALLEQSTALALGRDLVDLRRSPLQAARRLVGDVRDARRRASRRSSAR
jgi:hypothetical protein